MKHPLQLWYFTDTNDADDPVTVESETDLKRVFDEVLTYEQFHPTVVCVSGRPLLDGPLRLPDHQLKFAVDTRHRAAAIHAMGPADFVPTMNRPTKTPDGTGDGHIAVVHAWVTQALTSTPSQPDNVTLYLDVNTRTPFPPNSIIPLEKLWEALLELGSTGQRPTCVNWQQSTIY